MFCILFKFIYLKKSATSQAALKKSLGGEESYPSISLMRFTISMAPKAQS